MYTAKLPPSQPTTTREAEEETFHSFSESLNRDLNSYSESNSSLSVTDYVNRKHRTNETTCPYCSLYSVDRYQRPSDAGDLQSPPQPVPVEIQAVLIKEFGNNPGLHMHLYENHRKDIVDSLEHRQQLISEHISRLDRKDWIVRLIQRNTPEELARVNRNIKGFNAITELNRVVNDIIIAEQQHPFLIKERKQYQEDLEKDPYARLGIWR